MYNILFDSAANSSSTYVHSYFNLYIYLELLVFTFCNHILYPICLSRMKHV